MHLGHALSALLNHGMAEATDGRLLLRIEDIDVARCTPQFEAGIHRDLDWLGVGDQRPVRRQSEHFAEYDAILRELVKEGLVYPAFMSRARSAPISASARPGARAGRAIPTACRSIPTPTSS